MENILFYTFSTIMTLFAIFSQIFSNNINRIFSLIVTFFCAAILCIMLYAEFIASMIIIVYMGAIAMLFVFIIMIIGDKDQNIIQNTRKNLLLYFTIPLLITISIISAFLTSKTTIDTGSAVINTQQIGHFLYHTNWQAFIIVGIGLFVSMIGVIMITKDFQPAISNQNKLKIKPVKLNNPEIKSGVQI